MLHSDSGGSWGKIRAGGGSWVPIPPSLDTCTCLFYFEPNSVHSNYKKKTNKKKENSIDQQTKFTRKARKHIDCC